MKRLLLTLAAIACLNTLSMAQNKTVQLRIIQTSDVHGCFFPYDFITRRELPGSMARISSYVDSLRSTYGNRLLLLDNGDILQGQPTCYYTNYVATGRPNIAAEVVNYMKYDAQTFGNHDVETGHAVYDKWIKELNCPVIGANIVNTSTGKPYVKPYVICEREGVKIAIMGMLTPAIPNWLNEQLWSGMRFDEMVSTAQRWMDYLKKYECPDVVVGLFHSGRDGGIVTDEYEEDASLRVAQEVPGFDIIMFGHDHAPHCETVVNREGGKVLCLDPSSHTRNVADAQVTLTLRRGKVVKKEVDGRLVNIEKQPIDQKFVIHFQADIDSVCTFVDRVIGSFDATMYSRDCFFGPAAFTDLVHDLQLKITDADISFTAPLSFNSRINAGDIRVGDMFNLYKYENQLYVLRMTGEEVRRHLEMSYDLWVNTMTSPDDHIMQLNARTVNDTQRFGFKNFTFNFDSAAGIDYEVDVTKPDGEKVRILRMSNGEPFDPQRWYRVVMNSYRGNGGGELLTRGAGIAKELIPQRIEYQSDRDLRYYLMKEIEKEGNVSPRAYSNWRFVPEEWTQLAIERDREMIFGKSTRK